MLPNIKISTKLNNKQAILHTSRSYEKFKEVWLGECAPDYVQHGSDEEHSFVQRNFTDYQKYFAYVKDTLKSFQIHQYLREYGTMTSAFTLQRGTTTLQITSIEDNKGDILAVLEGILLSQYNFDKYKTKKNRSKLVTINIVGKTVNQKDIVDITNMIEGVYLTRNLVNEPYNMLNTEKFTNIAIELGKKIGFDVEIYKKRKLKRMGMGGLLAASQGSLSAPRFIFMEYLPDQVENHYPYILIGKCLMGRKTDSGFIKNEAVGGATVLGLMYAVAKAKLPIHIIGLIPITDDPKEGGIFSGDVVKMLNKKTVEVDMDVKGQLMLADALTFAKNYKPELVFDFGNLTDSSIQAVGYEAIPYMSNVTFKIKNDLENSGREVYERLVEFPLWQEYDDYLKSDIADLKGHVGKIAGTIITAKFLQYFVDFPWVHFDLTGRSFDVKDDYKPIGVGLHLVYRFLKSQLSSK